MLCLLRKNFLQVALMLLTAGACGATADTTYLVLGLCPGLTDTIFEGTYIPLGGTGWLHFEGWQGNDSVVQVKVIAAPEVDFWATTEPICPGSNDGYIEFWDHVGLTAPYQFSCDGGQTYGDAYIYFGFSAGHYELRARDKLGCVWEDEIIIDEYPPLSLSTPQQLSTCADSVLLAFQANAGGLPFSWEWTFGDATTTDTTRWATSPGTYRLRVANACDTIVRKIEVRFTEEGPPVRAYTPNAFSPNGDGINDCFQPLFAEGLQLLEYQLLVYDRWGEEVFRATDLAACWEGKHRGRDASNGLYAWLLVGRAAHCDGTEIALFENGALHLVR